MECRIPARPEPVLIMGLGLKRRKKRRRKHRLAKMEIRSQRAKGRQATRAAGYAAGIDPNAFLGDAFEFAGKGATALAGASAARSLGTAIGGMQPKVGGDNQGETLAATPTGNNNVVTMAAIGLGAYLLLKK